MRGDPRSLTKTEAVGMPRLGSPEIVLRAKALRKRQTGAEAILWERLRKSKLDGFKFRRQHPLGRFVLDFYCEERQVAIEVDGDIHDRDEVKRRDAFRQRLIEEAKIKVLRFTNDEVMHDADGVIESIRCALHELPPEGAIDGP